MKDVFKINSSTFRIEDGGVRFFLFCGSEKAALIDTGMEKPDAKEIAGKLTSLPLILITPIPTTFQATAPLRNSI